MESVIVLCMTTSRTPFDYFKEALAKVVAVPKSAIKPPKKSPKKTRKK